MNRTLRRLVALAMILGAFGLRVYRLDYQELRGDEAFGYFFSTNPIASILKMTVALREPHPIGSYVLEKAWAAVAGHSEFALRFLSAWFGLLAVALLYRLARSLRLSEPASLLAAGLLAVSPYALWHSQDARMYSMSLALTVASSWLALETVERPTWRRCLSYVAVTWLALNVHYFTSFVVLAQDAWVLGSLFADRSRRATLWRWLELQALLALLYIPWLIVAGNVLTSYEGTGESPGLPQMVIRSFSAFAVGETLPTALRDIFAVVGTVLAGWGAVRYAREGRSGRAVLSFLLLCLLLPLGLSWIGALSRPIFNERYMIAAVPPFYLLVGAAFEGALAPSRSSPRRLGERASVLRSVLLGGLLVGMALSLNHYYGDPAFSKTRGWRDLASTLGKLAYGLPPSQARVVENFPDPTLWYYYPDGAAHVILPPAANDAAGSASVVDELARSGVQRVILPLQPAPWWDGHGLASSALAGSYLRLSTTQVANWPVEVYVRPPGALLPSDEAYASGLRLTGQAVEPQAIVPGGLLAVYLRWASTGTDLPDQTDISLQVLNEKGALVAQLDRPLGRDEVGPGVTTYGLPVPPNLAPGQYRLILVLYHAVAGTPRLLTASHADHLDLAALHSP